jgi:hypothetical protein
MQAAGIAPVGTITRRTAVDAPRILAGHNCVYGNGPMMLILALLALVTSERALARCQTETLQQFKGRIVTPELLGEIRTLAGADLVRKLPPDSAPTMDFRPGRVNLHVNAAGEIIDLTCG